MSTVETTLDESEDDWLPCGHSSAHADADGQCVVCNVAGAVGEDEATKTALTADQAAESPFEGAIR